MSSLAAKAAQLAGMTTFRERQKRLATLEHLALARNDAGYDVGIFDADAHTYTLDGHAVDAPTWYTATVRHRIVIQDDDGEE